MNISGFWLSEAILQRGRWEPGAAGCTGRIFSAHTYLSSDRGCLGSSLLSGQFCFAGPGFSLSPVADNSSGLQTRPLACPDLFALAMSNLENWITSEQKGRFLFLSPCICVPAHPCCHTGPSANTVWQGKGFLFPVILGASP